MNDATQKPVETPRRRLFTGRRLLIAGLAAAGITAAGASVVMSQPGWGGWGHGPGYGYGQGYGPGPGMMGPQGHSGMMRRGWMGGFGPEGMIDFALSSVNATPEQKQRILAVARGAMTDLMPLRDRRDGAQRKLAELLKAPTIDRAAIERLRAEEFAAIEAGTRRATQAIGDAAEVLSAAQRQLLVERWEWRRAWRRG
jgi:periplasmic protein CpxP/Spy